MEASSRPWKFCSSTCTAYADPAGAAPPWTAPVEPVATPPAGGPAAGRLRPERSIAPGRLNGCCVMGPSSRTPRWAPTRPDRRASGSAPASVVLDDVHRGFLGAGAGAVDADVL